MKLLNYTTAYFAAILLVIIAIWSILFYEGMLTVFYDEITEGLGNQKQLLIRKAKTDKSVLEQKHIAEGNFSVQKIDSSVAKTYKDAFLDTVIYMASERKPEPARILRTTFSQDGQSYLLTVAATTFTQKDIIKELIHKLLWLYVGLVSTILILNNLLVKKAWRPFYSLLNKLENFSLDNPKPLSTEPTNIKEFQLLNKTVKKMIDHNLDIFNSQKQFIENAAHELQTPIAISRNKLETLAETDGLTADGMGLLSDAINNLERLTRLNKTLLLLTKINNRQFDNTVLVDMNELVQKVVDDFNDQLNFSNVHRTIDNKEKCVLEINADLALILITNLVKNAIVHNIKGGSINIIITNAFLQVENTGKEVALNSEKIFSRFYKESQSSTSTGLGLAIVKAVSDLYNFNTTYSYNQKHIIKISFNTGK